MEEFLLFRDEEVAASDNDKALTRDRIMRVLASPDTFALP